MYNSSKSDQVLSYSFQPRSLTPNVTYHTISAKPEKQFSFLEFLATLTLHIPDKWAQTIGYHGIYATVMQDQNSAIPMSPFCNKQESKPKLSKTWAACMKRIFEVDPLVHLKRNSQMKMKAFITDSKEITRLCKNLDIYTIMCTSAF